MKRLVSVAILLGVIIALALSLGACGDDDDSEKKKEKDETTAPPPASLTPTPDMALSSATAEVKTYTIGVINESPVLDPAFDGFQRGMSGMGYVEGDNAFAGENTTYLYDGAVAEVDGIAEQLVAADVDLILTLSTPGALAAQKATAGTDIPVVFVLVDDPAGTGLVQDLANPGGNITGVMSNAPNMAQEARRLELLLQLSPTVLRVYVPYHAEDAAVEAALAAVREAATALGVDVITREVRSGEDAVAAALSIPDDVDAIFLLPDSMVMAELDEFVNSAVERALPLTVSDLAGVEQGALMSYGVYADAAGEQAAHLAARILEGANPGDLPVETPEFYLTIHLGTADAIGMEIPDAVLMQAASIIRD